MHTLVRDYLRMKDFQILKAGNGREALEVFQQESDITLTPLDVMMPRMDGFETLKEFRHISGMPVLTPTVRAEERDKLQSFSLGMDKCITEPFSPRILLVRIDAILKRTSTETDGGQLEAASICLNECAREVTVDGKEVELSFEEFELFRYFLENQGVALSRGRILNRVQSYGYFGDVCTVDTHVKELRARMGEEGTLIQTIWSMGCKFESEEA